MKNITFVFLIQLVLISFSFCWWDAGHMLVAKIAELTLKQEDPEAFELGEKITNILNIFSHGRVTNFVESACWPDDVKTYGLLAMNEWHFIDIPVRISELFKKANVTYKDDDALGTIHSCVKELNKWNHKEIESFDTQFEKSLMARYLIHVVGDVHQPLHASSLFDNDKFKNGDEGGNLFLIKYKDNIENLHKLFDSGVDKLKNIDTRPLGKEDQDYLETTANDLMQEFTKESLPELLKTDPAEWVLESHDVSQTFIYRGIKFQGTPSDEFIETGYKIIKKRIALGGYRLAELFKAIKLSYEKSSYEELMPIQDQMNFLE